MSSILTFSVEDTYGVPKLTQDYTVDLLNEEIVDNLQYEKPIEFNHPTPQQRFKTVKTVDGRISLDFTYENLAWGPLFQTLMGQKIPLSNSSLATTPEKWNILTGMLTSGITSTQTTFSITEYTTGEFDNIDGIIVRGEYIAVTAISNGSVTLSTRGQTGTVAASHPQNALVYGVVNSPGHTISICSRYRNGFSYFLPTSLTLVIKRVSDYFAFSGIQFQDFVFNAVPTEGTTASFMTRGMNSSLPDIDSPSVAMDDNQLIDTDQVNCYSMGANLDASRAFFEVSNSLSSGPPKFLNNIAQSLLLNNFSTYGQFTAGEQTLDFYNSYNDNDTKNLSISICDQKLFSQAYVFAFNDVKWGTMVHTLGSSYFIYDSIPFYCYGEDDFTILIQN